MKVTITGAARSDLADIRSYLRAHNPGAAKRIGRALGDACLSLGRFPNRGKAGAAAAFRELLVRPYVIVYRVAPGEIQILRVWHSARDRGQG